MKHAEDGWLLFFFIYLGAVLGLSGWILLEFSHCPDFYGEGLCGSRGAAGMIGIQESIANPLYVGMYIVLGISIGFLVWVILAPWRLPDST
jgi:hypothetical protein